MGKEKPVANCFFIGVDIQALVTFREKILKKKYRNVLVVSKKSYTFALAIGKTTNG